MSKACPSWGDRPLWALREHSHYYGAAGNQRQWIGEWLRYWQPIEEGYFTRSFDYENPEIGYAPGTVLLPRLPVSSLPDWSRARVPPTGREPDGFICFEVAAGWPWIAFQGACVIDHTQHVARGGTARQLGFRSPAVETADWAIPVKISNSVWGPVVGRGITMLPLRPIFPGAIYSVLFYASIVFVLLFVRDTLRRVRRVRRLGRGRCPACNHELAGLATCPECGTVIGADATVGP